MRGEAGRIGGFTLLETLVALALLGIALMGVTLVFAVSLRELSEGDTATRAFALGQALIESKQKRPYSDILKDDLDGDGVDETQLRDDGVAPDAVGGDGIFTASRTDDGITRIWTAEPDRPIEGMTRVVIETRWTDDRGHPKSLAWLFIRHDPAFSAAGPP